MKQELWLIWKTRETRERYKVGSLVFENNTYTFKYLKEELKEAKSKGFLYFPGFEDLTKTYVSEDLFANIETRLPNPNRPDYESILASYNLKKDSSKFSILASTKGRLITDNYEFVPIFNKENVEFDIAGTRHCPDIKKCSNLISVNDKIKLELEPNNEFDKHAIKVLYEKENTTYHIGYVPKYYSSELSDLLKNNMEYSAIIESLNFESAISDEDITAYVKLTFE